MTLYHIGTGVPMVRSGIGLTALSDPYHAIWESFMSSKSVTYTEEDFVERSPRIMANGAIGMYYYFRLPHHAGQYTVVGVNWLYVFVQQS